MAIGQLNPVGFSGRKPPPLSRGASRHVRRRWEQVTEQERCALQALQIVEKSFLGERWRTVRDAISGLPDPRGEGAGVFANHEFRDGARTYAGHSGSILDEPSKTIKAGTHGVPGGENTLVQGDGSLRYYTVRESARIQTFPDAYRFHGSWTESMRQIGNAVPVKLANIIGASVIKRLQPCANTAEQLAKRVEKYLNDTC